jgi:HD-GYP domain-containing protein (c-di-GMP phosphodiesterase class II)
VYKAAYDHEEARSIIVRDSGTHFDPDIVEAFLRCEQKFKDSAERTNQKNKTLVCPAVQTAV